MGLKASEEYAHTVLRAGNENKRADRRDVADVLTATYGDALAGWCTTREAGETWLARGQMMAMKIEGMCRGACSRGRGPEDRLTQLRTAFGC